MPRIKPLLAAAVLILGLLAACSPEANRTRGEKGADVGNSPEDPAAVEIHGKVDPGFDVPTIGQGIQRERR